MGQAAAAPFVRGGAAVGQAVASAAIATGTGVRSAGTWVAQVATGSWRSLTLQLERRKLPRLAKPPKQPIRLYVGPANFAGQGTAWAHAAATHLDGVGSRNSATVGGSYSFPVDMEVPADVLENKVWQDRQVEYLTKRFTHVLIESGRPLFGTRHGRNSANDIALVRQAGVSVALVAHGSDVRLPSRHAETHEWSPFHEQDEFYVRLEAQARREGQVFNSFDGITFVSTPDLLADIPAAKWLPVVIDPDRWQSRHKPLQRDRPVVLHVPTNPRFKGSSYVDAAMQPLHDQGLIEYRRISGIPSDQMPAMIADADIVLEQFVLGPYSVTACEAMAAGRVVVAAVDESVRAHVREATGLDLPVVQADPGTLAGVVEQLVTEREAAAELAARGPEYVRAVHDGTMSAAVLATWLNPHEEPLSRREPEMGTVQGFADLEIAAIVPCHNEAAAIGKVVSDLRSALPTARIYVYDNNSTDNTAEVAKAAGAIVRRESRKGKGNVVRRAFADVDADVYLLIDGDDTYDATRAGDLVATLLDGPYDHVIGVRKHSNEAAYRPGHTLGNRILTGAAGSLFGRDITDMLSGYRAFSRRYVKSFPALSREFEIETELTIHSLHLRVPVSEVEVGYKERPEGGESKLRTYRDGIRILGWIVHLTRLEKPTLFHGSLAGLLAVVAMVLGIPVVVEYLDTGLVPRLPTAVLASSIGLISILILALGYLLDAIGRARQEAARLAYLRLMAPRATERAVAAVDLGGIQEPAVEAPARAQVV